MTAFKKPLDLVGVAEVCQMLELSKQRVDQLSRTSDWPTPVVTLRCGRVWYRYEIGKWLAAHSYRPVGRPPKARR